MRIKKNQKLPFGNGYAIFDGLERIIEYLQMFHFTESDLAYLSKEARKLLDEAGFVYTKIYTSNDLDEYTIMSLHA